jgi:hypothetical protein
MTGKNDMTSESKDTRLAKKASLPGVREGVNGMFGQLTEGLKSSLDDLWSLEINTMVVSDIGGYRFNPIHCYESIYLLPDNLDEFKEQLNLKDYARMLEAKDFSDGKKLEKVLLDKSSLPKHIRKVFGDKMFPAKTEEQGEVQCREPESIENMESTMRKYIVLRDRLRLAFQSCVIRGDISTPSEVIHASGTPKQEAESMAAEMVPGRESIGAESDKVRTYSLPNLEQAMSIGLLDNSAFLRELRSLRELYYLVGGQDATDSTNFTDLIAAQTIIQMDGDVMNRFHKALLNDCERDFLIQTHQQALSSGQENWKNLVKLIIESIQILSNFVGLSSR